MAFCCDKARELKFSEPAVFVNKKLAKNFVEKALLFFEI
jgi:hypothetical protein